ncbi:MAG TPA: TonB-dependent receptor [Sphingobium sp.]
MIKFDNRTFFGGGSRAALAIGISVLSCAQGMAQSEPARQDQQAAKAQESSENLGDIVVTATRQGVRLGRVPASIAAYDTRQMDKQGVKSIADISRLSPGLNLTAPGASPNDVTGSKTTIAIRGIASTEGAATTGIYINDTPIQVRATGNISSTAYPQIFDIERVEVLRGPQGTLFGAGAEGGAVRFIVPTPSLTETSIYSRSELAATEHGAASYEGGVAIGTPLIQDKLGIRVSGWYRHDGGWIDRVDIPSGNIVDRNVNSVNSWTLRGALAWQPISNLTLTLSAFHQDRRSDNPPLMFRDISDLDAGEYRSGRVLNQPLHDRFTLPALDIKYELGGGISLTSNTSFFIRDQTFDGDYTNYVGAVVLGNPFPIVSPQFSPVHIEDKQRSFTQEVRIQSNPDDTFSWLIGGFYGNFRQSALQINADTTLESALIARYGVGAVGVFGTPYLPGSVVFQSNATTRDRQVAGFGQAGYEILSGLKLTAGVRVARNVFNSLEDKRGPFVGRNPVETAGTQKETPITPRFGLSYQPDSNNLFYVSAAKGFRTGGVNTAAPNFCNAELQSLGISGDSSTYKSDSLWSYEAGTKNRILDGHLTIAASVFHIKWKDIQQRLQLTSCGVGITANLGKASSNGFDLSLQARPSDRFTAGFSIGYADAKLDDNIFGTGTTVFARKGQKIGGPPITVTMSGQYDVDLFDQKDGYFRVDTQFVSESPTLTQGVVGADPTIKRISDSYYQVSMRAGVLIGKIDASIFVDNLLGQTPILGTSRDTARSPLYYISSLRPRTFGMTLSYRYN